MRRVAIDVSAGFLLLGASMAAAGARASSRRRADPEAWQDGRSRRLRSTTPRSRRRTDGVVFVGSSSIRLWDMAKSFPELPAINRGFGGSQICDSTHFADVLVVKHQPRLIVFYAGDNDIDCRQERRAGARRLPRVRGEGARVAAGDADRVHLDQAEHRAVEAARRDAGGEPADRGGLRRGRARWSSSTCGRRCSATTASRGRRCSVEDGLHMNETGYKLWTELVRPHLDSERPDARDRTITDFNRQVLTMRSVRRSALIIAPFRLASSKVRADSRSVDRMSDWPDYELLDFGDGPEAGAVWGVGARSAVPAAAGVKTANAARMARARRRVTTASARRRASGRRRSMRGRSREMTIDVPLGGESRVSRWRSSRCRRGRSACFPSSGRIGGGSPSAMRRAAGDAAEGAQPVRVHRRQHARRGGGRRRGRARRRGEERRRAGARRTPRRRGSPIGPFAGSSRTR